MPKLSDERRAKVEDSITRRAAILKAVREQAYYTAQHCHFCNWASNGLTREEAVAGNKMHEATHPEYAEYMALQLPVQELLSAMHDHECDLRECACKCGHPPDGKFCILVLGPLCSVCLTRANCGDSEHGLACPPGKEG